MTKYLPFLLIFFTSCQLANESNKPENESNKPEIVDGVDLRFHMILDGEKSRPDLGLGMVLEMNGNTYNSTGNFGRFRILNIEKGEYDYKATVNRFTVRGSVLIDSSYVEEKFGTEYFSNVPVYIHEVSGTDTSVFSNGNIKVEGINYDVYEGKTRVRIVEKGERLKFEIISPAFETMTEVLEFENKDEQSIYLSPQEYRNIKGSLIMVNNTDTYPLPNESIRVAGRKYQTDDNGNFTIASITPGVHNFEISIEGLTQINKEVLINSSTQPNLRISGPKADFFPLDIGNYWKFQVTGKYSDSGIIESKLNYTSQWHVENFQVSDSDTIYTIKGIKNGYRTRYWNSDTVYYDNAESEFFITISDSGRITFKNSDYNFANPHYYGAPKYIYRYNLSYFSNITVRNGYDYDPESDPNYSSYSIFTKGVGLTSYLYTSGNISTTSPYSVRYRLLEYKVVD